jgi:hypothetical protein
MGTVVTNPFGYSENDFCSAYTGQPSWTDCRKDRCKTHQHVIPVLAVYNDKVRTVWAPNSAAGQFSEMHTNFCKDTADSYILTNSLLFDPLNNSVIHGLMTPREIISPETPYLQHIKCTVQPDGSLRADCIDKVNDPVCKDLTTGIGVDWSFSCNTNPAQNKFAIMLLQDKKESPSKKFKLLVSDAAAKSCAYSNAIEATDTRWIGTSNDFGLETVQSLNVTYRDAVRGEEEAVMLTYHCDQEKCSIDCREHVVAVDLDKPTGEKTISVNNLWYAVRPHILSWLAVPVEQSASAIKPKAQRLMHCYKEDQVWPREIFETYFKTVRHINDIKGKEKYYDAEFAYFGSCELENLGRYCQIEELSHFNNSEDIIIVGRNLVRRQSKTATMYADAMGCLYYCATDDDLYNKAKSLGNVKYIPFNVCKLWAAFITKENPEDPRKYLHKHRHEALQVTAQQYTQFYRDAAAQYARRTWDNGVIGAYWWFDNKGMHICFYDLMKGEDNLIGDYLKDRHQGTITDVQYTPGQEPIFTIQ